MDDEIMMTERVALSGDGWRVLDCGDDVWRFQTVGRDGGAFRNYGAIQALKSFLRESPTKEVARSSVRVEKSYKEELCFFSAAGQCLAEINLSRLTQDGRSVLSMHLEDDESVYGGGCRFDRVDRRGSSAVLQAADGWNRSDTMYLPTPFFTTSRGVGVLVNTYSTLEADFGESDPETLTIASEGDETLDVYVFASGSIGRAISAYYRMVGETTAPKIGPGPIVCRHYKANDFNTFDKIRRIYDEHVRLGVKPAAMIIEPWPITKAYSNESVRAELDEMSNYFKREEVPLLIWSPCGSVIYRDMPGFKGEYLVHCDIYSNGALIESASPEVPAFQDDHSGNPDISSWYHHPPMLDITNPEAVAWFENSVLKFLLDHNIRGAKIDFCEFMGDEGREYGKDKKSVRYLWKNPEIFRGISVHHAYPSFYNVSFYRSMCHVAGTREGVFVFCRGGGGVGNSLTPYYWAGDQVRSFAKLHDQLRAMLTSRLSGCPYMAYDMAGYAPDNPPLDLATQERVFARALGFTKYMPILQTHGTVAQFFEMSRDLQEAYRDAVRLRGAGLKLVRPLVEFCPDDLHARAIEDEFLYGDDLLVAPILDDTTERKVYLPAGEWIEELTGRRHLVGACGKTIMANATIYQTPSFRLVRNV